MLAVLTCKEAFTSSPASSIKCFKRNTLNFSENFPAFVKNFPAFVKNFLAFQKIGQAGLRRFCRGEKHSIDFGVEIDRDPGVAQVWGVVQIKSEDGHDVLFDDAL